MSELKFYSVGIVAENKSLESDIVEVSPVEELPMMDGEVTTDTQTIEVSSQDKDNKAYTAKTYATNTVPASWLPFCNGNRVSSPDVRRGAVVMLYQMADENKYYWTTLKNDLQLRKLETVLYAFSATQSEADAVSGENYYYLEISTHKKLVTFHTSKANGEPYGYDLQFDTGTGSFMLKDDINNFILLDSHQKQIRIENSLGNFFEIVGNDCNMKINGNFNKEIGGSENFTVDGSHSNNVGSSYELSSEGNTFTAPENTLDAPQNTLNGNLSVNAGDGAPGNGTIEGTFTFKDSITVMKDVTVDGVLTANKLISITAIDAPNIP